MKLMNKKLFSLCLALSLLLVAGLFSSCGGSDDPEVPQLEMPTPDAVLVLSEGNFQRANASLEVYDPNKKMEVITTAFYRANHIPLGDTAQSILVRGDDAWICVNTSMVIYHIGLDHLVLKGVVRDIPKPRHIHFVSDTKAYVTHLEYGSISIINPKEHKKVGEIKTYMSAGVSDFEPLAQSTEQMVPVGDLLFVNCWSYQNQILVIDTKKDEVIHQITVGQQPSSMALDAVGNLWVLCDERYSKEGSVNPSIYVVDTQTFKAKKVVEVPRELGELYNSASSLTMLPSGKEFLFISHNKIYKKSTTDIQAVPTIALELDERNKAHAIAVAPRSGEIYVADAIDFNQRGVVYRYSADFSNVIDKFKVGIIPGDFAFYSKR